MKPKIFKAPFNSLSYSLFTNEKDYEKYCKKIGVRPILEVMDYDACVVEHRHDKGIFCGLFFANHADFTENRRYSLLVHESVHIWQFFVALISESSPSDEFEAYTVQEIFLNMLEEYQRQCGA